MQQVALILRLMTSWNFTEEELALLRSMPKHEAEPHEPWLAKPPTRPRHVQRTMVFRGEWTPEFGDAEFSVYIRRGLFEEGDFSCGISYLGGSGESLILVDIAVGGISTVKSSGDLISTGFLVACCWLARLLN